MAVVFNGLGGTNVTAAATSTASPQVPSVVDGALLVAVVLGTPSATYAPHTVTMPSGWTLIGEKTQDAVGLTTDLYLGAWWKVGAAGESAPTITVSSGFYTGARWQARLASFSGQVANPAITATDGVSNSATPYTLPSITTTATSAVVGLLAQRQSTAPTTSTANGFTRTQLFTSASPTLASSGAQWFQSGVAKGSVTMPTATVATDSYAAVIGITFDIPEALPITNEWGVGQVRW